MYHCHLKITGGQLIHCIRVQTIIVQFLTSEHIDWTPAGGGEPTYEFDLFSRSGFKRSVEEAADERENLRLFDLSDIVAVLERGAKN